MRGNISAKFHVKNGVKNGKFHANFTLLGSSADAINSRKPVRNYTWNEYYTKERQSHDSNRNATNAGSARTKFCVSGGRYDRQGTLVI